MRVITASKGMIATSFVREPITRVFSASTVQLTATGVFDMVAVL